MKFLTFFALLTVLFLPTSTNAQARKRIGFRKNLAEASGIIRGAQTLDYVFRARRNAGIEIWIDHADSSGEVYPKFVLIKPDGAPLYDENSPNFGGCTDLKDILPEGGDYTLRLLLPEEARSPEKPVKFTLRLKLN